MDLQCPERYRAALYIRLSKEDDQEGPSESVTNQQSLLEGFVREHGVTVHDLYIDDGWSGTSFDRPGFQRMLGDIEHGQVNLVLTKDLSRLGRDYILTGHYLERYFPEHGVRYISLLDGIDTGVECAANDITPFRAILNDLYAKDISKKIRSVKRDKQRKGLFIGGKAVYGYQLHPTEKNRIIIDEGAAPTVRRIFTMALAGQSCRRIAAALNEEGVPSPAVYCGWSGRRPGMTSGAWTGERVSDLLQNEMYIGNMVQGRRQKISYKSKACRSVRREDWVVVEHTHPPLVAEEHFQTVQRLLDSRRHTRSRTYEHWLKGMIFCHECGHPMGVINRKTRSGEDRLYLVCRTYQRFTRAGRCTSHCIKEETVRTAVERQLRAVCDRAVDRGWMVEQAQRWLAEEARRGKRQQQAAQGQVERLNAALDRLYLDRVNGLLREEDFVRMYRRLQQEREVWERRLSAGQDENPGEVDSQPEEVVEEFLSGLCSSRALLVALVERVELTEQRRLILRFRCAKPGHIS